MLSRKPWRAEFVLLFGAAQFFCFFAGAFAISLLHKLGVAGFKGENDFGNILIGTLCFQGATWILIPIFLRLHGTNWRDAFGLRWPKIFSALFWAPVCFVVILPIALLLENGSVALLQKFGLQPQEQDAVKLFSSTTLWPTGIYLAVFAVVIAPVAEEFIFRGMLFPFVKQLGFPKLAWLGVSFLFALIHANAAIFLSLFVLALALAWLYEKTDCLLAPIFVHSLFNAANLVVLFATQLHVPSK
jgi:membrane protease YdiL (CAAX protease family)